MGVSDVKRQGDAHRVREYLDMCCGRSGDAETLTLTVDPKVPAAGAEGVWLTDNESDGAIG